jgi:hypothetical protein
MVTNSSTNTPTGATGTVLQGQGIGTANAFSTATYPATATGTGTILRADGTNWSATTATYPATTTVSQILYSSSANVVSGLATANRAVLTTNATGVPVATALATDGQLIIGSTAGAPAAATLTQGTGITITNASNSITISATTGAVVYGVTELNHASSTYVVLSTDFFLSCDTSGGVLQINLPNAPTTGRAFVVKDKTGSALTSNITITTVGGSVTIDGATSFVLNANYQAINLIFNGTVYEVY